MRRMLVRLTVDGQDIGHIDAIAIHQHTPHHVARDGTICVNSLDPVLMEIDVTRGMGPPPIWLSDEALKIAGYPPRQEMANIATVDILKYKADLDAANAKAATVDAMNQQYVDQLDKAQKLHELLAEVHPLLKESALGECGDPEQDAYERDLLERVEQMLGIETPEADPAFTAWLAEVDAELVKLGFEGSYTKMTGAECWREMFTDGMSPKDAAREEIAAGDE